MGHPTGSTAHQLTDHRDDIRRIQRGLESLTAGRAAIHHQRSIRTSFCDQKLPMIPSVSHEPRNRADIILDLEQLTREEGFLYTFCALVADSLFFPAAEAAEIDWRERLNTQELSYLLGLMVKNAISDDHLPTIHGYQRQFTSARRLMEELQETYLSNAISLIINNTTELTMPDEADTSEFNDDAMVEAMFYGSNSAQDISYVEMAAKRYKQDTDWIHEYLGIPLEEMILITKEIKELTSKKYNNRSYANSFHDFCQQLLSTFTFQPSDILAGNNDHPIKHFDAFTSIPGQTNREFSQPGEYNTVQSHPLIKLGDERYFLPIVFDLMESIYLSPFYWMLEDSTYRDRAFLNRGQSTERMALNYLARVFGKENVYHGVIVTKGKQQIAEIDVLAVHRNKAVVVQAKSKKLTIEARVGNVEALKRDFQHAVQDAFDQALKCMSPIIGDDVVEFYVNQQPLELLGPIDDVSVICLTGEDYPAIASQLRKYLIKTDDDPFPIAISIFDLAVLAHYLSSPVDFLYYLRQRSHHADYFYSESELAFLAFHLANGIARREDADIVALDSNSYFQKIDAHYLTEIGVYPASASTDEFIWRWRDADLDQVVQQLIHDNFAKCIDASFFLFDIYGPDSKNLMRNLKDLQETSSEDGGVHTLSFVYEDRHRGISVITYPREQIYRTNEFADFALARKYKAKADEWIVMGSIVGSRNLIDLFWYCNDPWRYDSDLERLASTLLREGTVKSIGDDIEGDGITDT